MSGSVIGDDPFRHYDGAYALGTLDSDDRAAFEAHLPGCPACRARVAEMRRTADLLRAVTAADVLGAAASDAPAADLPDELLPGLLRQAGRERRRRRTLVTTLAGVAAAALVALVVLVWPSSGGGVRPAEQAFAPVRPSTPVHATAVLTSEQWGTRIDLRCRYELQPLRPITYRLVVVDKDKRNHDTGSWAVAPGTTTFVGGTEVSKDRIAQVQITMDDGRPIMILEP
ncbi:anti-sigma factor family protein [Jatrophihabitans fulvus]